MIQPVLVSVAAGDFTLRRARRRRCRSTSSSPAPRRILPGRSRSASARGAISCAAAWRAPERRFLGIEIAAEYHRLFVGRARRRGVANWLALRGDALYLAAAVLPAGFAAAVHVYFPDPWPKTRHHKRRLFDPETVDLVLGLLRPGGRLFFATDFLDYGERVAELLAGYPGLAVARRDEPWDEGPRTNYEAKYEAEGRPILRLEARLRSAVGALIPAGRDRGAGGDRPGGRLLCAGARRGVRCPQETCSRRVPAVRRWTTMTTRHNQLASYADRNFVFLLSSSRRRFRRCRRRRRRQRRFRPPAVPVARGGWRPAPGPATSGWAATTTGTRASATAGSRGPWMRPPYPRAVWVAPRYVAAAWPFFFTHGYWRGSGRGSAAFH